MQFYGEHPSPGLDQMPGQSPVASADFHDQLPGRRSASATMRPAHSSTSGCQPHARRDRPVPDTTNRGEEDRHTRTVGEWRKPRQRARLILAAPGRKGLRGNWMADQHRATGETQRLLITGAAGQMGQLLRPLLRRDDRSLRLSDVRDIGPAMPGEETLNVDITDPGSIADACRDVDAVLHLAAISSEAPFDEVAQVNVKGTRNLLRAAVDAGVRCVVLASSNHGAGFYRRSDVATDSDDLGDDLPRRPDTFYGWSKAARSYRGCGAVCTDADFTIWRIASRGPGVRSSRRRILRRATG